MNRLNLKIIVLIWILLPSFLIVIMPISSAAAEFARIAKQSNNKTCYLRNGDFQQRYDHWRRSIGDISRGSSQAEIINFPHGRSGKALHISHTGSGHIQFAQILPVPGPDLIFTASFQANSREGMMRAFSGSGVAQIGLQYFDEASNKLGSTILVNYVKNPFADTPLIGVPRRAPDTYTMHYIEFVGGEFNQNYTIDIRQEIESNLMGINPEQIRSIAVIIWCGANHEQAGAEMWVADISLNDK